MDQRSLVGCRRPDEPLGLEPREHEAVDFVRGAQRLAPSSGNGRDATGVLNAQCGRYSAPLSIQWRRIAICFSVEGFVGRLGRHAYVDVGREDPPHELAALRAHPALSHNLPGVSGNS